MLDDRARITVSDVVLTVFALLVVGALAPVFYDGLDSNANVIGQGPGLILQALIPLMIIVLLRRIWVAAVEGSA